MNFFGRRLFVLIADDNRDLARGLSILFKLTGFDVEIVHDGRDVLKAAKTRRPDVLLLDIGLPGMDGFQVARELRSDPAFENLCIIAISGYDPDMHVARSRGARFDHYLIKPADFTTITSLIASLAEPGLRA